MSRFTICETPLRGLMQVRRQQFGDARGSFSRLFCVDELREAGWGGTVVQINHTITARAGTVRGMHFQHPPHAEIKLVSCLRGEVLDVALDIRANSPTFLKWHAVRLSVENQVALLIPQGFAHGFQSLTDNVELLYCHSAAYAPEAEGGFHPLDKRLGIAWPLPVAELSARDASHAAIVDGFTGVVI